MSAEYMQLVPENDEHLVTLWFCDRYNCNAQEEQVGADVEGCWCNQDDYHIDLCIYLKVLGS